MKVIHRCRRAAGHVPNFCTKIWSVESDGFRIGGESSWKRVFGGNEELHRERFASQHVDAAIILRENVFSVIAETQGMKLVLQWRVESFLGYKAWNFL